MDYAQLITENVNPDTVDIDLCDTEEIVNMIHREDCKVAPAVGKVLPEIAKTVDMVVERIRAGGRLIYVGAGTSGRLGVLDASECPPTFGTDPGLVVGVIAGGVTALRSSIEGAEDCYQQGAEEMDRRQVSSLDAVVGITASGNARYVLGALERAKALGAATAAVCNAVPGTVVDAADVAIVPIVGPEAIMGSTRMKAGTAEKMVLNMITTASMVKLGKVYRNLMVDLTPTNAKLRDRAVRMIMQAVDVPRDRAEQAFQQSGGSPKVAILMLLCGCGKEVAQGLLQEESTIRRAVGKLQQETCKTRLDAG